MDSVIGSQMECKASIWEKKVFSVGAGSKGQVVAAADVARIGMVELFCWREVVGDDVVEMMWWGRGRISVEKMRVGVGVS